LGDADYDLSNAFTCNPTQESLEATSMICDALQEDEIFEACLLHASLHGFSTDEAELRDRISKYLNNQPDTVIDDAILAFAEDRIIAPPDVVLAHWGKSRIYRRALGVSRAGMPISIKSALRMLRKNICIKLLFYPASSRWRLAKAAASYPRASSCRIRSLVTPNSAPTSFRVNGSWL
jgi:hypothetical protein